MIKKLRLKFFQSWKDVELIFKEGLNIIIGSSNSGKSSLLRAIYWVIQNRPSGNSFINHSQLKNGNIEGEASVEIETEKGTIKREKSKKFNGYFINDKKLEAVGLDVPEEVSEFFNFSEVNIQKQLDSPFLLSESGGEIAKFFNKILKLDTIDLALKKIDEVKRENNKELNIKEQELNDIKKQLEKLGWIDDFKIKIDKLENIEEKIKIRNNKINEIENIYYQIKNIDEKLNGYFNLEILLNKVNTLLEIKIQTDNKIFNLNRFEENLESLIYYDKEKNKYCYNFNFLIKNIEDCIMVNKEIERKEEKLNNFMSFLSYFKNIDIDIINIDTNINDIKNKFPNICPLCGNILDREKILEVL